MGLVSVTLEGTFSRGPRPARGTIWFTLAQRLVDADVVLDPIPYAAALDGHGAFTVDLFTTDAAPAAYWVREQIQDAPYRRPYLIGIHVGDGTLNLSDLTPLDPLTLVPLSPPSNLDGGDPDDSLTTDLDGGAPDSTYTTTVDGGAP